MGADKKEVQSAPSWGGSQCLALAASRIASALRIGTHMYYRCIGDGVGVRIEYGLLCVPSPVSADDNGRLLIV